MENIIKTMASDNRINSENSGQALHRGSLEALLGFQLRRAQIKLFQHFKSSMTRPAITPGQAGVLMLIENNPGISQAALARAMEIERATLGETIAYLQKNRWVERRKSSSDGRSYALHLSASGKQLVKKLQAGIRKHEKAVCDNLNTKERLELLRLLTKFNKS
jgi:DNA-binding MarR family transcriptional regulator